MLVNINMKISIGIIGFGFVGKAISNGFAVLGKENFSDIIIYDPKTRPETSFNSIFRSDYLFICVPTPMSSTGEIDTTIIESVFVDLNTMNYAGVVVIKSTTTPVKVEYLINKFKNLKIITNPEYLTERCANEDFIKSPWIVVGDDFDYSDRLMDVYAKLWPSSKIVKVGACAAMMAKYMTNSWFATKVSLMNEFRSLWNSLNYGERDWEDVVKAFSSDDRVGPTHLQVPGPDGDFGFGGKCFVKDINAMIHMCKTVGSVHNVMAGACATNQKVRTNKDWLLIDGAVSCDYSESKKARSLFWYVDVSKLDYITSSAKLRQISDYTAGMKIENIDNIYVIAADENKFCISETDDNLRPLFDNESEYLKWLNDIKSRIKDCVTVCI
jgi:UDP-N-acetyl-D-mannosaminuronate dehydrogenase